MGETDDERNRLMAAWGEWFQQAGAAMVDMGNPVGQARTVRSDAVSEGGGANPVSGYSILEADSIDRAVDIAKTCPVVQTGGSVEVAETFSVM